MQTPTLNWLELARVISEIRKECPDLNRGVFVDRIIVPERPKFPEGYLKGEWALRLVSRKEEYTLLFSVRPRHPYLGWISGKGPRAATQGTHSAFDLALSKHLKGARLSAIEALAKERVAVLWFNSIEAGNEAPYGLVLSLIPATPEAFLVRNTGNPAGWEMITSSGPSQKKIEERDGLYVPPDGAKAPLEPPLRLEWIQDTQTLLKAIETGLEHEAFERRIQALTRSVKDSLKLQQERVRQSTKAVTEAEHEPDWLRSGDLLKSVLHNPPPLEGTIRKIPDYSTGETADLVCDPKLNPQAQVEKFYQQARRKQRRISEAKSRISLAAEAVSRFEKLLSETPALPKQDEKPNWPALERLERASGQAVGLPAPGAKGGKEKRASAWSGKSFISKDGATIWVGRNKDENLELTFKHARGNDIWMHLRGRPSSHAVIPIQPGKSASLETLLDAAQVIIYYSGGKDWGKTEVDYTFKKFVKRIKDSTEASYINSKTLLVTPDPERLKRLLD